MTFVTQREQTVLMQHIKRTDKIIFVIKGTLILLVDDKTQYTLNYGGEYFADQSLELLKRQLVATPNSVLGLLDIKVFREILEAPLAREPR